MKGNFVIIDTETGGLNPKEHDLLTIGFVFVVDGQIRETYEAKIKKESYRVSPSALAINKIDLKELYETGETIEQIRNKFKMMCDINFNGKKAVAIGHNLVSFDLPFLFEQFMDKESFENYISYRYVDTCIIARFLIDSKKINCKPSLSSLMEHYNLGTEQSDGRHTALKDALWTLSVYKAFLII